MRKNAIYKKIRIHLTFHFDYFQRGVHVTQALECILLLNPVLPLINTCSFDHRKNMNRGTISLVFILIWGCGVIVSGFPLLTAVSNVVSRMGLNFVNRFTSNFMNRRNSDLFPEWAEFKVKFISKIKKKNKYKNKTGIILWHIHLIRSRFAENKQQNIQSSRGKSQTYENLYGKPKTNCTQQFIISTRKSSIPNASE